VIVNIEKSWFKRHKKIEGTKTTETIEVIDSETTVEIIEDSGDDYVQLLNQISVQTTNNNDPEDSVVVTYEKAVEEVVSGCTDVKYRAYIIVKKDATVVTGYKRIGTGVGCETRKDPTTSQNKPFRPGIKARLRPMTLEERHLHGNLTEVVIESDVYMDNEDDTIILGDI